MDTERTTTANWPLRREIGNALGYAPSPHYAWAYLDGDKWREYPAWDVDLNVAMVLVDTLRPVYFELSYSPDRMNWRAEFWFDYRLDAFADDKIPAMAICRAWLQYTER